MSQDGDEQSPDGPDEFDFYFRFTKPLVLYLPTSEDRAIAAAWVEKLEAEPETEEEKRLRLDYLKLLLFVLQRGRLSGIFRKQPPSGPLQPFPQGFNMSDMGHLMIDQDDIQGCGGGDARTVPYTIEISNDLREFVAAQEIPNFGVQMYYAWSSDDPIHKWSLFDEEKFPQYVLDKIKLLKEIKSDEKTAASKGCGAKKLCDIPLIEKYTKTKVKSPQEIEKAQGRSYQAYMGFVGRMGGGFKDMCDDDADKYRKGGRCQKKPQKKCGPGDMPMDEEYETFLSGLSGNQGGNQGRGCPYQGPAHSPDCDNQMKSYDNQQGSRSCSPKSRTEMPGPSAWASPVPRGQNRKPPMNFNGGGGGGGCPDQSGMMDDMQMNACPQRRSLSPTNRNCPPRSEPSPSQNNCNTPNQSGRGVSSSPCPRDEEPAGARPGLSSACGRQGGGGQPQPTAGMKQWTTPVDASFAGLPNRCPPPPQNDMMQCGGFDQRSQGPPMNQRGQDDSWCPPDMSDMQDSRRKEKKGKQQMGQDCRDDDRAEMPPCPRPFQSSPPSCPSRQGSSGYNSCSPPQSPQMQCKSQPKKQEMDMCARQQQPQDMDYCPDNDDSMYGSAMPSTPRGPPGGNFCGGNQSWRPQGPPQQAPMKAINFDYSSGFDDGCNNQQMNRSNDNDPCGQRNDPCARMKDPCSQPPRNMPCRPPPKMQSSPCPPNSYPQNGNGARNMGGMDGMKPKQDAGRDKCERKPLNDACPRPCPPPCPPPPQQQSCNRTPTQQQQQPPPQSQFCSPATHQIRLMPPSNFSQQPPMRNVQTAGGMGGAPYGRNLNSSMSKQSQQAYCPPQQSRKSPPPMYETYNMSKNNGGMNMMGPCPQGPPSGNFRGNYNQGMSQGEDCPEVCPEEEDDECTSAPESMDDRAQGSSSADCFDPAEEEAECMDDMQSAQWGSPKARPQAQAQPPPRSYNSMVNQRTKAYLDMVPPDACRRKNKIVASTPKKGGYNDSVSFGDSMSTLKPVDQSYNNYFTLPNESAASYMQIEDNYGGFPRGGPCGPPQQQNDQSFGGSEQGGRGACPRPKEKKRRGGPSVCDDNAQFDQGCKQSCGGY